MFPEVEDLKVSYYDLGIQLGISPDVVEDIKDTNDSEALKNVLMTWLTQHGHPTWRRFVEALDKVAEGNYHKLAKAIASEHPSGNPLTGRYH